MTKRLSSLALLLPIMSLLFWTLIFLMPALWFFFRLEAVARGSAGVSITSGNFQLVIASNRLLAVAFDRAGWIAEKPITIVDAPAKFVETAVSWLVARTPNWTPSPFLHSTWRCLTYPIYALLPWFYVGRGIDALFGRYRVDRSNMIGSLILSIIFLALCCGFKFGMSAAEREGQELLNWMIEGLALWGVLFAIPFIAWVRQKIEPGTSRNRCSST